MAQETTETRVIYKWTRYGGLRTYDIEKETPKQFVVKMRDSARFNNSYRLDKFKIGKDKAWMGEAWAFAMSDLLALAQEHYDGAQRDLMKLKGFLTNLKQEIQDHEREGLRELSEGCREEVLADRPLLQDRIVLHGRTT